MIVENFRKCLLNRITLIKYSIYFEISNHRLPELAETKKYCKILN